MKTFEDLLRHFNTICNCDEQHTDERQLHRNDGNGTDSVR